MKKNIIKRSLLFVFFLFCGFVSQAADDLITRQIVINLDEAGTLKSKVSEKLKNKITNLKLTGEMNVTDMKFIREMAGAYKYYSVYDKESEKYEGNLQHLDLSNVKFVGAENFYVCGPHVVEDDDMFARFRSDEVGSMIFVDLENLQTVILPNYLTSISNCAFMGCCGLKSFSLSANIESIAGGAFAGCIGITTLNVDKDNKQYSSEGTVLFNKDKTEIIAAMGNITNYIIPNSVSEIAYYAFYHCTSLCSVDCPEGLTQIGIKAFAGCSSLSSVSFPEGLSDLGTGCFKDCISLTSVSLPKKLTLICPELFWDCCNLTSVTMSDNVESIGECAFYNCRSLSSISLSPNVTNISHGAFSGCRSLSSISLSPNLKYIGDYAFEGCKDITSIDACMLTPVKITKETFEEEVKANAYLYVPQGHLQDYKRAEVWRDFREMIEYDFPETFVEVSTVDGNAKEVGRYSVNGQHFEGQKKGLNIVKYSDGTAKTVLVK